MRRSPAEIEFYRRRWFCHLSANPGNHYGFDHSYGSLAGAVAPWAHTCREGPYLKTWHRDEKLLVEGGSATE